MGKTKRMIYIRDENVEFYDKLDNKSDFVNECLKTARLGGVEEIKTTEVDEGPIEQASNMGGVVSAVEAMKVRDKARLDEYRKKKGLYDPTASEE